MSNSTSRNIALISGYGLNTLVLAVAGLLMIPALVVASSLEEWASIAVGQALGGLGGVIIGFGWGIVGPTYVANATRAERYQRYTESLFGRLSVAALVLPLLSLSVALIVPGAIGLAVAAALVTALVGIGPGWYFVGRATPWMMIALDTSFRTVSTALAIILLNFGASAYVGLLVQGLGIVAGTSVASAWILLKDGDRSIGRVALGSVAKALRRQGAGVAASSLSSLYAVLPITIVSAIAPSVLPFFAPVDKLQKQLASAWSPAVQVFQSYVARGDPAGMGRRISFTLLVSCAGAALFALTFSIFGQPIILWLTAGQATLPVLAISLCGVTVAVMFVEQVIGRAVLAAKGLVRFVARGALAGSILGLVGLSIGATTAGLTGVQVPLIVGVLIMIGVETAGLRSNRTQ